MLPLLSKTMLRVFILQAIFLPEASDFIARNGAESVKTTKEAGPIESNMFIKGLQEQAVESDVSITAGVHLPTDSETHVPESFSYTLAYLIHTVCMGPSLLYFLSGY